MVPEKVARLTAMAKEVRRKLPRLRHISRRQPVAKIPSLRLSKNILAAFALNVAIGTLTPTVLAGKSAKDLQHPQINE